MAGLIFYAHIYNSFNGDIWAYLWRLRGIGIWAALLF